MPASDLTGESKASSGQDPKSDIQRREALIKLGKYTAYATPILLATVTAAEAISGAAPSPSPPESDARLKMNITPVTVLPNGLRLYSFQYRRDPRTTYVGVLAQDLLQSENSKFRDAVIVGSNGYYAVKYDELGLKMFTIDEWRQLSNICRDPSRFTFVRASLAADRRPGSSFYDPPCSLALASRPASRL
jgi:Chaperone of endosialidase